MIELDVIDSESPDRDESGPTFWRHLNESDTDDAEANDLMEFAPGDSKPPSGASRRQFLQLMGAAMAMAGLVGCRRPEEKILPYSHKPEKVIPGISDYYATGMPFRGVLRPVLAESKEGRPTKIEGNAEHPSGQSGTSPFEQASVLNLYDPDRSRSVRKDGETASWDDFVSFCRQLGTQADQKQVAVLVEETSSLTVQAMRQRMSDRFPNLQWVSYSPEGTDARRLGMQQAFGRPLRPRYELEDAEVIVSLDANFLDGRAQDFSHATKAFGKGRRLEDAEDTMSRLYTIESRYSTTGGSSDHRLSMRAGRIPAFAAALAAELGVGEASSVSWSRKERLHVREIARDLRGAGENGVVMAGESQPPEVHALAMALNQRLDGIGTTVTLFDTGTSSVRPQSEALSDLTASMRQGDVDALFMLGVNPVYDAPSELNFEDALANVPDTVHLGRLRNETAQASRWHVPRTHYLEQWGDGRAYDGTLSVIQPLIRPLYDDAHSTIEVLNLAATGVDANGHDLVREQWRPRLPGAFEEEWRRVVHDGYLEGSRYDTASVDPATVPSIEAPAEEQDGLEVVFRQDPKLLAGRFSNNPWMQELPDPITKIVWDNVAVMSQATAEELGVEVRRSEGNFYADRVELTLDGQTVELPIWVQPGHPDGSIGVSMGYGRTLASTRESKDTPFWDTDDDTNIYHGAPVAGGLDAAGEPVDVVGVNVAPLRPASRRVATGAEASKVDSGYLIATTQEEGSMHGRPIVRWATLEEFKEDPYFVNDVQPPVPDLGHSGDGHGDGGHGGGERSGDGAAGDVSGHGLEAGPGTDAHAAENMPEQAAHGGDGSGQPDGPDPGTSRPVEEQQEYPMIWQERHPKNEEAYKDNPYYGNQWGMTIDLNTCTGCNACVVACTSENNVQVVGKEEVSKGRHMYWIRNDRYYVSEEEGDDDPEMLMQTVMCQHCENAPCESVCPVAATVHSPDGTNQMIYNRCIGTRYCQNNCPYKVRRFNFYNWSKTLPVEVQMAQNPEVSVRSRGVMEKCTWCIHRVRKRQRQADNEERDLRPNEVETACQEACPTDAITFGDLNNPESDVVEEKKNPRRYQLLSYL
ncbi:MAG: 4Fe-4S dicluster domain-containing protein, partial [Salinibacter sp.]|uniref:4Fe-4S dicluster domain-containing protein n=1 Tax=Salinibacter sp. TaxID=2065818 RepID=UPI0035D4BA8A